MTMKTTIRVTGLTKSHGDTLITMFGDLADLWECAAIDGDDPVEFAETFAQAYSGKQWIAKERARLTKAIEDSEREEKKK